MRVKYFAPDGQNPVPALRVKGGQARNFLISESRIIALLGYQFFMPSIHSQRSDRNLGFITTQN